MSVYAKLNVKNVRLFEMLMYCQSSEGIEKSAIRASRRLTSLVLFPSRRLFPQLPAVENTVIHKTLSDEIMSK